MDRAPEDEWPERKCREEVGDTVKGRNECASGGWTGGGEDEGSRNEREVMERRKRMEDGDRKILYNEL